MAEGAVKKLLSKLGAVCEACSSWNPPADPADPAGLRCEACGAELPVVAWLRGDTAQAIALEEGRSCGACGSPLAAPGPCPVCCAGEQEPEAYLEPGRVRLVLLRGIGAQGRAWDLREPATRLGKRDGAIRFPADASVPPLAATVLFREGRVLIRDEGSGCTFVRMRREELLRPGALFSIGDQLLRFSGRIESARDLPPGTLPFGSPLPKGGAAIRIEQILPGGTPGAAWVRPAPLVIGRTAGGLLFPDDPYVSGRHCELELTSGGAVLRDLHSSNGTFVQVVPGSERVIRPGDTIRLGRNILRLETIG